tara:strand:- start:202 stop:453 length:252 start_codon:yes stop_codon:yes gene_type:complete
MKMISCPQCDENFPELRKTKYGYNFCVNCSEVGAKRGVPMTFGTGDHTWTETLILDEKDYLKHINPEGNPELTFGIETESKKK